MKSVILGLVLLALAWPARGVDAVLQNTSSSGDPTSHRSTEQMRPLQLATTYAHPNYYLIGIKYLRNGAYELAIHNFNEAIRVKHGDAFAYGSRGMAYHGLLQYDAAIRDFDRAVSLNPEMYWVFNNRGNIYHIRGEYNRAIRDFNESIRLNPDYAVAFYNRGLVYAHKSGFDQATRDLGRALRLKPNYVKAYNDLAWLLATMPDDQLRDGREAVRLAREAVRLEDDPANHDTLAAAYAEAGEFDNAVAEQMRAIEMLQVKGQLDDLADYQRRFELYQRRQPYRE